MAETASSSMTPEEAAAAKRLAENRRRKERREAKIKAGGTDRLNKITGLGGGLQREAPKPEAPKPEETPKEQTADPAEVDISEHYYQPTTTPRIPLTPPLNLSNDGTGLSPESEAAQLRALLAAAGASPDGLNTPGQATPGSNNNNGSSAAGFEGADDPMAAMLNQMMAAMGGGAGAGGGFPGMPGAGGPNAGPAGWPPGATATATRPSHSAALWRLVHFAVAVALGLYIALATPFSGTQAQREAAALAAAATSDETTVYDVDDAFAVHKRYFFYAFATAETVLLTSRFVLAGRGVGGFGSPGDGGLVGMALGFLPPAVRRTVTVVTRYWQIFSTVRTDLLVCIFVLGVCSWIQS